MPWLTFSAGTLTLQPTKGEHAGAWTLYVKATDDNTIGADAGVQYIYQFFIVFVLGFNTPPYFTTPEVRD